MRLAVFICNNETMGECFALNLFGTNEPYGRFVHPGDLCLLYNYNDHQLFGVWEAVSNGGNHVPRAWGGKYPNQVNVKLVSKQLMSVPGSNAQSLLNDVSSLGRVYEGQQAQELLQHFASVFHTGYTEGEASKAIEQDYRNRFPPNFFCDDGHRVRSQGEKIIDDWLFHHDVKHAYEPVTALPGQLIPDFVVWSKTADPIYIEYWGMINDALYEQRRLQKCKLYAKFMLPVIELYPEHLQIIDTVLGKNLTKRGVFYK
jgi:hypothetical protein